MSIASEITRINNNIAAAYTAIDNKGGTLPLTQNSANLASTISNLTTNDGSYIVKSLTELYQISNPQQGDIGIIQISAPDKTEDPFGYNTTHTGYSELTFNMSGNIYISGLSQIYNKIRNQGSAQINASGVTDTRYGLTNLMTITSNITTTYSPGSTITFTLKIPITENTFDEISVTYTDQDSMGSQFRVTSTSGLDNTGKYTSDNLKYLNFQDFVVYQISEYETVSISQITSNVLSCLFPGGYYIATDKSYKYNGSTWVEITDPYIYISGSKSTATSAATSGILYVCPRTVSTSVSTMNNMSNLYSDSSYTNYKNYLKKLKPYGTALASYFKNNATTRAIDCSSMCINCAALEEVDLTKTFLDPSSNVNNYFFYKMASAFSGCTALKSITLPAGTNYNSSSTTANGGGIVNFNSIFKNCSNLNSSILSLTMPSSTVLAYDATSSKLAGAYDFNSAFYGCTKMSNPTIELPNTDWNIYKSAFLSRFNSIAGTNGLDLRYAFYNCTGASRIDIYRLPIYDISQNGTVKVDSTTFYGTTCSIRVDSTNTKNYLVTQTGLPANRFTVG